MTDTEQPTASVPADPTAFPHKSLARERSLYLIALLLLLINRGLVRYPHLIFPSHVLENQDSWFYLVAPAFGLLAIIYCMIVTWRFFEFAGVSRIASILNGLISPFFFPLVYLPQAIYVLRRASKLHAPKSTSPAET